MSLFRQDQLAALLVARNERIAGLLTPHEDACGRVQASAAARWLC